MRRRALHHIRGVVLTFGAVLGVVCVVSVAAGLLLDVRPLVVQSGSMSPAFDTGALAWARHTPASDLDVGDIVMVENAEGRRVTHRIVGIERHAAAAVLELRGDANPVPDAERYSVTSAYVVFADVPYGGRVVAWLSGPVGLFLLGMYAMGLLAVVIRPGGPPPSRRGGRRRRGATRSRTGGAAAGALLLGVLPATPASATFSDQSAVSGTTLSTHVVQRPDNVTCSVSGQNVTFAWPEKDARYDYEVVLWREGSPAAALSANQVTGSSVSLAFTSPGAFGLSGSLLGISQSFYFHAEVRSWLSSTAGADRWQSADVRRSSQRVHINVNCLVVLLCSVSAPSCVA